MRAAHKLDHAIPLCAACECACLPPFSCGLLWHSLHSLCVSPAHAWPPLRCLAVRARLLSPRITETAIEVPPNRYTHLVTDDAELQSWYDTFTQFDRDGGGDVDLRELGSMFRHLGHAPSDREMREMIDAVDFDGSGTVDFEEWCLLMLRQKRALITPDWLANLFAPAQAEVEVDARDGAAPQVAVAEPPEVVVLKGAARRDSRGNTAQIAASVFGKEQPVAEPEQQAEAEQHPPLSRELLLVVADLIPNATHLKSLTDCPAPACTLSIQILVRGMTSPCCQVVHCCTVGTCATRRAR